jgi:hypothetical protein
MNAIDSEVKVKSLRVLWRWPFSSDDFTKRRLSCRALSSKISSRIHHLEIDEINFELIYHELPIYEAKFIRELKDNLNFFLSSRTPAQNKDPEVKF